MSINKPYRNNRIIQEMFDSIKNVLEGSGVSIADGGVYVISESGSTSGSGLLSHFLSYGVSNNHHVCFVSLQHTWGHFCNIGNKSGLNLRQLSTEGKVHVIEALKLMPEILDEGCENEDHPFAFILKTLDHPLKQLFNTIKNTVRPWLEKNEYFILVVDGLSLFLNLGVETKDIDIFFTYCKNLIDNFENAEHPIGTLVIVTKSNDGDEDTSLILNKTLHSAVVHMSLEGLSTGLSREVHGNLRIIAYNRKLPHVCLPEIQLLHYKMEDKNIKLFAPGTASGVL